MRTEETRPNWCRCPAEGACDWFCDCEPHHPVEVGIDSIPTSLYECRVCGALIKDSWRFATSTHLQWHEQRGDLR